MLTLLGTNKTSLDFDTVKELAVSEFHDYEYMINVAQTDFLQGVGEGDIIIGITRKNNDTYTLGHFISLWKDCPRVFISTSWRGNVPPNDVSDKYISFAKKYFELII